MDTESIKTLIIGILLVLVIILTFFLYKKKESFCKCNNEYLSQLGLIGRPNRSCVNYQPENVFDEKD